MGLTRITSDGITDGTITATDLATNIDLVDNQKLRLGTGNDLEIYHNGNNSFIVDQGTGSLVIQGSQTLIRNTSSHNQIVASNDVVELYYDNSKKFETTSYGSLVTGRLNTTGNISMPDNAQIHLGDSIDLAIYHDGTSSILKNTTGSLFVQNDNTRIVNAANSETIATFIANGAVELYHNNHKSFQTSTHGCQIFAPEGGSAQVYLYADEGDDNADLWGFIASHTSSKFSLVNYASGSYEDSIVAHGDGAVELYHDSNKKFETTSTGVNMPAGTMVVNGPSGTSYTAEFRPINANPYGLACIENSGANAGYPLFTVTSNGGATYFRVLSGTGLAETRSMQPVSNNTYDLGSTSKRYANIYTNDLNLSNEGGSNEVDGTWGSYTIQEGAEDLFLVNKRNGKKYKFNLTEVS